VTLSRASRRPTGSAPSGKQSLKPWPRPTRKATPGKGPSEAALAALEKALKSTRQTLTADEKEAIRVVMSELAEYGESYDFDDYREQLERLYEHETGEHPTDLVRRRLTIRWMNERSLS
jgi:glycerol-3-phosphate dehydrogenase